MNRVLVISEQSRISLKDNQILVTSDSETRIPLEDLDSLIIESSETVITAPAVTALADYGVNVVLCGRTHMPSAVLLPSAGNTRFAETVRKQVSVSAEKRDALWLEITAAKIRNQASALAALGLAGVHLAGILENLGPDTGNLLQKEGTAAAIYFRQLFGSGFRRDRRGEFPNELLNYGYAVLRSRMATALISSGLHLCFGIFHTNKYNAFALADDMMEPYRPYVDMAVSSLVRSGKESLDAECRRSLQRLLTGEVCVREFKHRMADAMEMSASSLAEAYRGEGSKLMFPDV